MGMLNRDLGKPWSEHFQEGDVFTLEAAKVGPTISTEYGSATVALLTIDGQLYSIIGEGIVNAVRDQEDGELPAKVKIVRVPTKTPGQTVKLLVPESWEATDEIPF